MLPLLYTGGGRVEAVSRDWFQFPACLFSISPQFMPAQLVHASWQWISRNHLLPENSQNIPNSGNFNLMCHLTQKSPLEIPILP